MARRRCPRSASAVRPGSDHHLWSWRSVASFGRLGAGTPTPYEIRPSRAIVILIVICVGALFGPALAPFPYDQQFRDAPSAAPGGRFLLGTDEIGRDRFSRLLYATRISIVLAPAAAAVSVALALLIAGFSAGDSAPCDFAPDHHLSRAPLDFSVHHSARGIAAKHRPCGFGPCHVRPDGARRMGVARAYFRSRPSSAWKHPDGCCRPVRPVFPPGASRACRHGRIFAPSPSHSSASWFPRISWPKPVSVSSVSASRNPCLPGAIC